MCKQRFCPYCSTDFTSPSSIIRCPVFIHHDPPLDPRRLICPANKWAREPHPDALHPGGGVCPLQPGPDDNYAANDFVDLLAAINNDNNNYNPFTPDNTSDTTYFNTVRQLAPAPRRSQPSFPHEGSELYVRPGDLFKPGMWQTVQEKLYRAEEEAARRDMEEEEREAEMTGVLEMERERLRLKERRRQREMARQRERESENEGEKEKARERAKANKERERAKVREQAKEKEREMERMREQEREKEKAKDIETETEEEKRERQQKIAREREWEESNDLMAAQWRIERRKG